MSEAEMFTIDDADNDGKIKREVGKKMVQNAKTHMPDMFKKFERVCEEKGIEPREAMGQHVLMALEDESHSKMLANTKVDMSSINSDNIRLQDAKFIQTLSEELGLEKEDKKDPIDRLIERRLEAKTGPIIPGANAADTGEASGDVAKRLENIQKQVSSLQAQVDERDTVDETSKQSEKKDVDELFAPTGNEPDEAEEEVIEVEEGDVAEVIPSSGGEDDGE